MAAVEQQCCSMTIYASHGNSMTHIARFVGIDQMEVEIVACSPVQIDAAVICSGKCWPKMGFTI